jgi:hypothetical protein
VASLAQSSPQGGRRPQRQAANGSSASWSVLERAIKAVAEPSWATFRRPAEGLGLRGVGSAASSPSGAQAPCQPTGLLQPWWCSARCIWAIVAI